MNSNLEKRIKRQVIGKPHRFLAIAPLGFEQTLAEEIACIKGEPKANDRIHKELIDSYAEQPHIVGDGKVEFTTKITDAWKIVAYSRIANRVLIHLADFKAENFRDFEKKSSEIPWELYLDKRQKTKDERYFGNVILSEAHRSKSKNPVNYSSPSLSIHVTCKHSRLYHSDAIAERLRKVIEDSFSKGGSLPLAPAPCHPREGGDFPASSASPSAGTPRNAPPQNVYVTFLDDRCTIWLDLAGEELYKRGHERFVNDAPLKETIAAGMLFEAFNAAPLPQSTLFDLMAGSGTFSLEAAYIANKLIPGVCRDFALKHQPAFKEATWNYILRGETREERRENFNSVILERSDRMAIDSIKKIVTSDISERAVKIIKHNVECSPLAGISPNSDTPTINPQLKDFFSYTAKEIAEICRDTSPIIVLNPPYGKRLDFDAPKLYTKIGHHLAALASELKPLGKALTVAILAPKDDSREGSKYTCTANLLRECPALSPEKNSAAKLIVTSHGGLTLNTFIAKLS